MKTINVYLNVGLLFYCANWASFSNLIPTFLVKFMILVRCFFHNMTNRTGYSIDYLRDNSLLNVLVSQVVCQHNKEKREQILLKMQLIYLNNIL